jgi:putative phosphoribosyl transferase
MSTRTRGIPPEELVELELDAVRLEGNLNRPSDAHGVVVFAHGSGSSRYSPRNRYVAEALQEAGLATLLFDLLTPDEELEDSRTAELRFDIGLLAGRLVGAIDWLAQHPPTRSLRTGLFGASTGGGAALVAAAGPTWPDGPWPVSAPPPCLSSAATTSRSFGSTSRRWHSSLP